MADTVLLPTRNLSNSYWFPDGPPPRARPVPRYAFTPERRVHLVPGLGPDEPSLFLGWLFWEGSGAAPVEWFIQAAEQYLAEAYGATLDAASRHPPAPGSAPQLFAALPNALLPVAECAPPSPASQRW